MACWSLILDYPCFSLIINLSSGLTVVRLYNVRGAQEVKDQKYTINSQRKWFFGLLYTYNSIIQSVLLFENRWYKKEDLARDVIFNRGGTLCGMTQRDREKNIVITCSQGCLQPGYFSHHLELTLLSIRAISMNMSERSLFTYYLYQQS